MPTLITLTTDFGDTAPYVAAMKGVLLSLNPDVQLVDLSHRIRPQDLRHADYFLSTCIPYFPRETIHVAVIDPGVGGERHALLVEVGGHFLLGPDNGLFTSTIRALGGPVSAYRLDQPRYWRSDVSATFHGRDLFAPVAAHLARGVPPEELGTSLAEWVTLPSRSAVCWQNICQGEIAFIDDFGNIITNIPQGQIQSLPVRVSMNGGPAAAVRWVRTYSDARPGELICLFSSENYFEIAEVQGNAARRLQAEVGMMIQLEFG